MHENRCRQLIDRAITTFDLNLSDLIVLTEAASGYYSLTPLIAAIAGAKQVLALTNDSRYGSAVDIQDRTMSLAQQWNVADRIKILISREHKLIRQADIVTNLGFVRPLDAAFLQKLGPTVSIPLMWETWEYRPEDLDLEVCRRLGIPVLGTNENHPDLKIFEYIGYLALKLLFLLDIEILRSRIVILGSGEFARHTVDTLRSTQAETTFIDMEIEEALTSDASLQALQEAEAIVVVEHHSREMLIGPSGCIEVNDLFALNPNLVIAHICGGVDRTALTEIGFRCYPERFAPPRYMSVATDYLGPRPLIDLHTAGLKVGEQLARAKKEGLIGFEAELAVLKETSLAQGFSGYHSG